jgi:phospholipid/cholesterol/gamma-HCH transport system ATP-binding protein
VVALVGRSGYGKTVLLKLISGLLHPEAGRVVIDGQDIFSLSGRALTRLRTRLGFLFQGGALFESLTVFDNVAFPLREKTVMTRADIEEKVLYELAQVGLAEAKDKYPAQLSGGMRKRAALARELVLQPEIMIFDEPTTGLDPISCNAILKLIQTLHERLHFTGIIATHEIPKVFDIVDKVAIIQEGVVLALGTPEAITSSRDPSVESFIKGVVEEPIPRVQ